MREMERRSQIRSTNETFDRTSSSPISDLNGFIGDLSRIVGSIAPIEKSSFGNERLSSVIPYFLLGIDFIDTS